MKRIAALLMALALLASLAACGGKTSTTPGSGTAGSEGTAGVQSTEDGTAYGGKTSTTPAESAGSSAPQQEQSTPVNPAPEPEELTLEDGYARLVCAKDNFVTVAFHGPDGDIGMHFCQKDGSDLEEEASLAYGHPSSGWTLASTYELSEEYTVDDLALSVTDYDAEKTADGTYPTILITDFGEPMTDDELKEVGFDFLDGRCCIITTCRATYGGDNFGLSFSINYFEEDYKLAPEQIDGFAEKLQFYAGNGTPLEDYFEGYTLDINPSGTTIFGGAAISVRLYQTDSGNHKERHQSMCDELKACEPYMVYTNADGTTQQFPMRFI